jgi:hydrogenase expression/formation protein HypD
MDQAVMLAKMPGVVIATYGDMIRVPGRQGSLAEARAAGATVEVVYSARQAIELARQHASKQVVFLAVGFETTAPGTGLAIREAAELGVKNLSVLTAHKLVLPAMRALLAAGDVQVDGFLCPGHVSVILGYAAYGEIARKYARPCVVAGFDPAQVVAALVEILQQLVDGRPRACTVYPSVSAEGNLEAQRLLGEVFAPGDAAWRALGVIPDSGLFLRPPYDAFDAAKRFELPELESYELPGCRCGDVICGRCSPFDCKLFGKRCTPRDPVGPCMVSSEGACAAAYKYERR